MFDDLKYITAEQVNELPKEERRVLLEGVLPSEEAIAKFLEDADVDVEADVAPLVRQFLLNS